MVDHVEARRTNRDGTAHSACGRPAPVVAQRDRRAAREHPGRSHNPLIKTVGLAWLEFEKPDLARAERFLADFGFTVTDRTPEALVLRGHWAGTPSLVVRRGAKSGFVGPAFAADARADLDRLASATDTRVVPHRGGLAVDLTDPSGFPVRVVHGVPELPGLPERHPLPLNFGRDPARANGTQRPDRRAAQIQRLGHVAIGTTGSPRRWTGIWTRSG